MSPPEADQPLAEDVRYQLSDIGDVDLFEVEDGEEDG